MLHTVLAKLFHSRADPCALPISQLDPQQIKELEQCQSAHCTVCLHGLPVQPTMITSGSA